MSKSLPPGPKGHFLFGNLSDFQQDPLSFLSQCSREGDDIVPLRFLHRKVYLLNNPDYIEHVLLTHRNDFVKSRMYKIGSRILGNGLVMSEGSFWLRQRRLMQPSFHRRQIAGYGQVMTDYSEDMLATWQDGQTRELVQDMMNLTLRVAVQTLFSVDVAGRAADVGEAFTETLEINAARFSGAITLPEYIPTPSNRRYVKGVEQVDEIVYDIINRRRTTKENREDLLDMLLNAEDEDGSRMTDKQVRDEVITLFLAGHETTAITLSWALYLVAKHPQVKEKLLAELDTVLGGRPPTAADFPQLQYTGMIINEVLRLYPSAPLLGRETVQAVELGGYHLPQGAELWIVPWIFHHSSHYFDEPEEFIPERWQDGLEKRLPKFVYFPFGGGPRLCIGNNFALMEARMVLATIAQRFDLELVSDHPVEPEFKLTIRPKDGVKAVVHKRPRPVTRVSLVKQREQAATPPVHGAVIDSAAAQQQKRL